MRQLDYSNEIANIVKQLLDAEEAIAKCINSVDDVLHTMREKAADEELDGADL